MANPIIAASGEVSPRFDGSHCPTTWLGHSVSHSRPREDIEFEIPRRPDPDPESEQQEAESEQQEALVSQLGYCGRSCVFEGDSSAREAPLLVSFVLVSGTALALAIHLVEATTDSKG